MDAEAPPPFYSFDADIGRLSVSTRRYSAAIVADNHGAFPYGGIELARLFDSRGVPIGGVGGRPPASFGVILRRPGAARMLATQGAPPRATVRPGRSPHGRVTRHPPAPPPPGRRALRPPGRRGTRGGRRRRGRRAPPLRAGPRGERVDRDPGPPPARGRGAVPQLGRRRREVVAVLEDGRSVELARTGGVASARVRYFHLAGPRGGYVLVLEGGGRATARRVARQPSAPRAGPTLTVRIPGRTLRARIAPASSADQAEEIARRLGA